MKKFDTYRVTAPWRFRKQFVADFDPVADGYFVKKQ
jgi:hypothetical protein